MNSLFTPYRIVLKEKRQRLALLLIILFVPTILFNFTVGVYASGEYVWDAGTTLTNGTNASTTVSADGVSLAYTSSTSDRTYGDFILGNNTSAGFAMSAYRPEGGVESNQGYVYTTDTPLALSDNSLAHTFLENNLLYISSYQGGLSVIDTKGTLDPGDDTLVAHYDTSSTPALMSNDVEYTRKEGDFLYISTWHGGLSVIDTKGTLDPSDDTLVTRYYDGSTPATIENRFRNSFKDGNLLYMVTYGSFGGIYVIDTKGTLDPSDDTLVTRYYDGSTPALGGNFVYNAFKEGNFLYASTLGNGVSVIDTKGTLDPSDDTLAAHYDTSTNPALASYYVYETIKDGNLLYVSTNDGLSVIDTKGTFADVSDDTLVKTYGTASTPAILGNQVLHSFLANNLLYVSTSGGVSIVDTKGTFTDASDDTLVNTYTRATNPALSDLNSRYSFLDNNLLYVSTDAGLSVLSQGTYNPLATYISSAQAIATTPTTSLSVDANIDAGQNTTLSYRTGTSSAVWFDDFNDGTTTEYVGDFYGWGATFNTAIESGGTMKLSNPNPYTYGPGQYVNVWIDTGKSDQYFPLGTTVTARVRVNSNTRETVPGWFDYIYNDDFWNYGSRAVLNNQWQITTFTATSRTFSKVGFQTIWKIGTWDNSNDSLEIDWIKITTPDSFGQWGSWVTCADITNCALPPLTGEWLQYKLDLTTTNTTTTPVVHSVSYNGPHYGAGTYTSNTQTFLSPTDLGTFTVDADTPVGSTVTYEYTTDGTTWNPVINGQVIAQTATAFTWRAHLSTTNLTVTPTIHNVTLATSPHRSSLTSTKITKTNHDTPLPSNEAVIEFKRTYPQYFDGSVSHTEIQSKIVELLQKTVGYLRLLLELK